MSKTQLKYKIQHELERVNAEIDVKIVEGKAYRKEARHHKMLLSQLSRMNREWMKPSFSLMSFFF